MDSSPVLPIFLMLLCTVVLALGLLIVARVFNPGRPGAVQQMPYESGMDPIHDTRRRFDVRFHLLAIAFLIFDVELLFLFPWAVAWGGEVQGSGFRLQGPDSINPQSQIPSQQIPHLSSLIPHPSASRRLVFAGAMTFLVLLAAGYVYDWRKGVFQWR